MRQTVPLLVHLALLGGCAAVDLDGDGVVASMDCNDRDPTQGLPLELRVDSDRDGFGGPITEIGCPGNAWLVDDDGADCDDLDPLVSPVGTEVGCDGRDNDCDPSTADGPAVTVGATWPSVQQALDAAGYGETVTLCASTIHERVVIDRQVTLRGAGAERTVLDGSSSPGSTITVLAAASIQDLTVTGGTGPIGGGIQVSGVDERVVLDGVVVRDNQAEEGGGVAVDGSPLALYDTVLNDNRATLGGGLLADGAVDLDLVRTRIVDNRADRGGGLWLSGAVMMDASHLEGNQAAHGGGAWLADADTWLHGVDTTLSGNRAAEGGGAYGQGTLQGLALMSNVADRGGGVASVGPLVLDEVEIVGNVAAVDHGGGVVARGPVELVGGSLSGNSALADGGGLYAEDRVTADRTQLDRNLAARGGGVYVASGGELVGTELIVRDNAAVASGGGLETACGSGGVLLVDGRVSDNRAPNGAAARVVSAPTVLQRVEVLENVAEPGGAAVALVAACAPAVLASRDTQWAANTPADLAVGARSPESATGGGFTCVTDGTFDGCSDP